MNWTELLTKEINQTYTATLGLLDLVDGDALDWKPSTGENWMTTGQLIRHIASACGAPCKGFATGDWGLPEGTNMEEIPPEEMLPPAEKLLPAATVAEAREALQKDRQVALDMIAQAGEDRLNDQIVTAPWDPTPYPLGHMMLQMVNHLGLHRAQLFYYLKLQGKSVNTGHLWGVPGS